MRHIVGTLVLLAALVLTGTATSRAQDGMQQQQSHTPSDSVRHLWDYIGGKLVVMAQDWPEDKYSYRLNADVRTFQQVLLHIAGDNYMLVNRNAGKKVGDERNDPDVKDYKSKEQTVNFLKKSLADGEAEITREGDAGVLKNLPDWIGWVEHMGEHYGLLVAYYRANGVVPPDSRPSK